MNNLRYTGRKKAPATEKEREEKGDVDKIARGVFWGLLKFCGFLLLVYFLFAMSVIFLTSV